MTLFSAGICVSAYNGENSVSPYYLYTYTAKSKLTISNRTAECESTLEGYMSVTKISAAQYLEKKNGSEWETVSLGTWSNSVDGDRLIMSNTKSNLSSGTYRLRTVFTVYSGTKSESVEMVSDETTI